MLLKLPFTMGIIKSFDQFSNLLTSMTEKTNNLS